MLRSMVVVDFEMRKFTFKMQGRNVLFVRPNEEYKCELLIIQDRDSFPTPEKSKTVVILGLSIAVENTMALSKINR
jgi:hypothetical protein